MQRWAMEECWEDIYHLRRGCGQLVMHRSNLAHQLQGYLSISSMSIN